MPIFFYIWLRFDACLEGGYPEPPLIKQHLKKPGKEAALKLAPMCDAPYYKGSEKLKSKVAIITGGDSGIGRAVAILFAREGADVAVMYLDEHQDAGCTKEMVEAEGQRCLLISGDVTNQKFCQTAVKKPSRILASSIS